MNKVEILSDFTRSNSNRTGKFMIFPVNTLVKDKVADKDQEKLATGYRNKSGTIPDVMSHVKKGHALCAGLLKDGKRRSKSNIVGAEWILVDIDNTQVKKDKNGKVSKEYYPFLTLEEAINLPFISKYCSLIYTSHSHTREWHKFRLVFLLPKRIENVRDYEYLVTALMNEIPGCDPSCKDASRAFYGSTKAEFPLTQPCAELPLEWVNEKLEEAKKEALNREIEKQARLEKAAKYSNDDLDKLITEALTYIPPREPGSNNYHECRNVLMALHSHYGEEIATNLAENWSPSIPDTTWDIPYKMSTFNRDGIGIGTLFYIAKSYGWKPPKDVKTFTGGNEWILDTLEYLKKINPEQYEGLDFDSFPDIEDNVNTIYGFLSEELTRDDLNGSREAGELLQERYLFLAEQKNVSDKKVKTEYKNLSNKNEVALSDLDRDLMELIERDLDLTELELEQSNLTQKHFKNRYPANLAFVEKRYEELFEKGLDNDYARIGQEIKEQLVSVEEIDYEALTSFNPLLKLLMSYCKENHLPPLHFFLALITFSTSALPSNLKAVYTKRHTTILNLMVIFFSESTAGKDEIYYLFNKALDQNQAKNQKENDAIEARNNAALDEWQEERKVTRGLAKPLPEPFLRKYVVKDANIDSRKEELSKIGRGRLLEINSEFTTLINGVNDRSSKAGAIGIEDELIRIYNGEDFDDSRVSTRGRRGSRSMSLISATQFERLHKAIDTDNKSGFSSRIIPLLIDGYLEIEDQYFDLNNPGEDNSLALIQKLTIFYRELEDFWMRYESKTKYGDDNLVGIDIDAFELMKAWLIQINKKSTQTPHKGFRQWLRRVRQNANRLCFAWHCVKVGLDAPGERASDISATTVMETIQLFEQIIPMAEKLFRMGNQNSVPGDKRELVQKVLDKQKHLNRPIKVTDIRDWGEFRKSRGDKATKSSELHVFLKSLAEDYKLGTYDKKVGFTPY